MLLFSSFVFSALLLLRSRKQICSKVSSLLHTEKKSRGFFRGAVNKPLKMYEMSPSRRKNYPQLSHKFHCFLSQRGAMLPLNGTCEVVFLTKQSQACKMLGTEVAVVVTTLLLGTVLARHTLCASVPKNVLKQDSVSKVL